MVRAQGCHAQAPVHMPSFSNDRGLGRVFLPWLRHLCTRPSSKIRLGVAPLAFDGRGFGRFGLDRLGIGSRPMSCVAGKDHASRFRLFRESFVSQGLASDPCRPVIIVTLIQISWAARIGACPFLYSLRAFCMSTRACFSFFIQNPAFSECAADNVIAVRSPFSYLTRCVEQNVDRHFEASKMPHNIGVYVNTRTLL